MSVWKDQCRGWMHVVWRNAPQQCPWQKQQQKSTVWLGIKHQVTYLAVWCFRPAVKAAAAKPVMAVDFSDSDDGFTLDTNSLSRGRGCCSMIYFTQKRSSMCSVVYRRNVTCFEVCFMCACEQSSQNSCWIYNVCTFTVTILWPNEMQIPDSRQKCRWWPVCAQAHLKARSQEASCSQTSGGQESQKRWALVLCTLRPAQVLCTMCSAQILSCALDRYYVPCDLHGYYVPCALQRYCVPCALHRYCVPSVLHRYCVQCALHRYVSCSAQVLCTMCSAQVLCTKCSAQVLCTMLCTGIMYHALHMYLVSCSAQVLCTVRSSQLSCTMRSAQVHMLALLQQHGAGVHTCWPSFCLPAFSVSDI